MSIHAEHSIPWMDRLPMGRTIFALLFFAIVAAAIWEGIDLRRWVYVQTTPIRFGDIQRGWKFGSRAAREGYLDLYDRDIAITFGTDRYNELDYAPLRLLVMDLWARQTLAARGQPMLTDYQLLQTRERGQASSRPMRWQTDYDFTAPALHFNTAMEIVGAVGMFFLVRLWVIRGSATADFPFRGWTAGLIAALLLWFNPAMLLSAHGWPTWDGWIVPFFIYGLLLASLDWWFCAGVVIGLGALFKGQQLLVAPFFVLWPIFMGRPGAAARWMIGAAFAVAMAVSVWMLRYPPAAANVTAAVAAAQQDSARGGDPLWLTINTDTFRPPADPVVNWPAIAWVATCLGATFVVCLRRRFAKIRWYWWLSVALLGLGAILWQWYPRGHTPWMWLEAPAILAVLPLAWFLPTRLAPLLLAGVGAAALLLCIPMFHASTGWFQIGWAYGEYHWEWMVVGKSSNIPGLLKEYYLRFLNLHDLTGTVMTLDRHALIFWPAGATPISLKTLLAVIYGITLVLCSMGAAGHFRRNDPRFLVAAVAPWVLMFAILGQMHERYLLFAAALGCAMCAVSVGMTLLSLLLTAITFVMTLHVMLLNAPGPWKTSEFYLTLERVGMYRKWIYPTYPGLGWAVILSAMVFLYVAVCPRPKPFSGRPKAAVSPRRPATTR